MYYTDMVYQRTDVDVNGKHELVVFELTPLHGGLSAGVHFFCESENWRTSTCDNISKTSTERRRRVDLRSEDRGPKLEFLTLELAFSKVGAGERRSHYIYGATFLPGGPSEVAQDGPLTAEFLASAQPTMALTSLYYADPERPEQSDIVYGAELLGVRPDGFSQLAFCTWTQ